MLHLPDGTLRRTIDDFAALAPSIKEHLNGCRTCQARVSSMRARVTRLESIFSRGEVTATLLAEPRIARSDFHVLRPMKKQWWPYAAAAVVGICALVGAYAPLRSLAAVIVTAIRDDSVRPVAITSQEAQTLRRTAVIGKPDIAEYSPKHVRFVGYLDKQGAERAAKQVILTPSYVPASLAGGYVIFHVRGAQSYRLKIAALGATLSRQLPPIVEQTYGERQAYDHHQGFSAADIGVLPIPQGYINIVQRPIAPVTIVGATQEEVRNYFRQKAPAIPAIAAALGEGVDPLDHMVLLRSDIQQSHPIEVLGVHGYAIKDSRGLGNILMWQKSRVMHIVEGSFSVGELLKVAQSLHR